MAPSQVSLPPVKDIFTKQIDNNNAPKDIFPDGIRTSGQHDPIYSLLRPYEDFPDRIEGPTVWTREDYDGKPEKWTHRFTDEEIKELGQTSDEFIASEIPLTGISQDNFQLPILSQRLKLLRSDLLNGKGFILFKGFPTDAWGLHKSAVGYMGLGTYLGYFVSQNKQGHVLGHVKDVGDDPTQIDKIRIYRTNARQFFHADDSDIVGLLCVARALEGGESDLVSSHTIYNALRAERPDVLRTLVEPIWYFDRKGETSAGQKEWIKASIFYLEPKDGGRVYTKWDPYFVRSLTRFSDKGLIPALSEKQLEAIKVLEEFCQRFALHMVLQHGDIQFLSNNHIFHARTAYTDHAPPKPRRHLMRLWLATPESEGGWKLPFADNDEKKRGDDQFTIGVFARIKSTECMSPDELDLLADELDDVFYDLDVDTEDLFEMSIDARERNPMLDSSTEFILQTLQEYNEGLNGPDNGEQDTNEEDVEGGFDGEGGALSGEDIA